MPGEMGNKKKAIKVKPKPKLKVAKTFNCLSCSKEGTMKVVFNRKKKQATLVCLSCELSKEYPIGPLDEAIDIYTAWADRFRESRFQ